ncbi:hypothetical protein SteCoe_7447 [Stentor coeruleus]|uniref:PPM-type phosphatase domain-containing protein n=1 Tax=Stentor coeruleus TaxID=5963 RepID=A0A1R2CMJ6_9CILI|nr:hypothetical protein SteCoe_7447 [Stentor coeruleus]
MLRTTTPIKKVQVRSLSKAVEGNKSQKIIPRHRPSNSYGGNSNSERRLDLLKQSVSGSSQKPSSRPNSSNTTDLKSKDVQKKPILHKKSSSISEKPLNSILSSMQNAHKHKLSTDFKKEHNYIQKYAYRTNTGFIPGNPNKVNQDSFIINIDMNFNTCLFAVADGHGINGEYVSGYIKDRYPIILSSNPYFLSSPSRAIVASAAKLNKEIRSKDFDTNFSGSTFVSVMIRGKKLWCANVGDSRALLGRQLHEKTGTKGNSNHWMSIALSRDHKPNESDESTRILAKGGRVEAYQDEDGNPFGPSRVWLKNQNIPGLAMSRSFGDKVASSVGVISEPEILEFELNCDDKFIVVGSDGVFEFLSNEDVVKLVVPYWRRGDAEGAAEVLAKEAKATWMREEEVIDDITCVVLFLEVEAS